MFSALIPLAHKVLPSCFILASGSVYRHFAYFFIFYLYTVHYRAETEICILNDDFPTKLKTDLDHHVSIYEQILLAYSIPPVHLVTHYL